MAYHTLRFLLTALLLMAFSMMWAQEEKDDEKSNQLTIDAQLMTRGEIRVGGMPTSAEEKDDNKANFIFNRTRLSVGYERDNLSLKVTARHQGVWGAEGGGSISVSEAWAQLKANNGLFARLGRQELAYDDERMQNTYAGVVWKPVKGLSCDASYHYLATATKLNELNRTLGHEIEFRASYQIMKDANISLGYSQMKGTETMEMLKRSTDAHKLRWG